MISVKIQASKVGPITIFKTFTAEGPFIRFPVGMTPLSYAHHVTSFVRYRGLAPYSVQVGHFLKPYAT